MIELLLQIDRTLFLFINGSLANPVTDWVMPIITNDNLLRLIYGATLVILLGAGRKRFVWVVGFSLLVVALTDQTSSALLKPWIGRMRPCKVMEVHLLVGCGTGFAFPSSHAANLFGQAVFFGLLFKKYLPYLLGFAFLVGVSRIFVGVHYPLDIVGGIVAGGFEGVLAAYVVWKLDNAKKLKPGPILCPVFAPRGGHDSARPR